jgi:hypothetical protein
MPRKAATKTAENSTQAIANALDTPQKPRCVSARTYRSDEKRINTVAPRR